MNAGSTIGHPLPSNSVHLWRMYTYPEMKHITDNFAETGDSANNEVVFEI